MKKLLAALMIFASTQSHASVLTNGAPGKKIETVQVFSSVSTQIDHQSVTLDLAGAGLRAKKVLFSNVKVYVAELFASDLQLFVRNESEALTSLGKSPVVAIRLGFLRTVGADQVQVSFREALTANSVNIADPAITQFLKAVAAGGDALVNTSLVMLMVKNADGTETIAYEDSKNVLTAINGPAGFSQKILSIWLGKPADPGLATLKSSLVSGQF